MSGLTMQYSKSEDNDNYCSNSESESSSEDDEQAELLTEEVEEGFLKVLSQLKKKDKRLYDQSVTYYKQCVDEETPKKKSKSAKKKTETLKGWLEGQTDKVDVPELETELDGLHSFWANPNLNKDEKFLRDYILNKKFLDEDKDFDLKQAIEKLENEENEINEQLDYEEKFNHRFENTDSQPKSNKRKSKGKTEQSLEKKNRNSGSLEESGQVNEIENSKPKGKKRKSVDKVEVEVEHKKRKSKKSIESDISTETQVANENTNCVEITQNETAITESSKPVRRKVKNTNVNVKDDPESTSESECSPTKDLENKIPSEKTNGVVTEGKRKKVTRRGKSSKRISADGKTAGSSGIIKHKSSVSPVKSKDDDKEKEGSPIESKGKPKRPNRRANRKRKTLNNQSVTVKNT